MAPSSALLLAAVLATTAATPPTQRPLPPGLEAEVARLVLTDTDAGDLPGGWTVAAVEVGATSIRVRLEGPQGAGAVQLSPRFSGTPPQADGFSSVSEPPTAAGADRVAFDRAAAALIERIAARDEGTLHAAVLGPAASDARGSPGPARQSVAASVVRAVLWMALLAGGLWLLARAWRRRSPTPSARWERAGLVALAGVAVALRLALPPWAPLHANDHGVDELRGLSGAAVGSSSADLYGPAYRQVVRAALAPTRAGWRGVLLLGALFGTLGVLALLLFTREVTGSRAAGWTAAVGLALHPLHIRLSVSESPMPLATALLLLGAGAWMRAADPRRSEARVDPIVWLGAVALALAAEMRVTTAAFPVAALLLALLAGPGLKTRVRRLWLPALAVGAFTGWHLWRIAPTLGGAAERFDRFAARLLEHNALLDPELAAPTLLPLALVGAVSLARAGRRRAVLGLGCAVVLLSLVGGVIDACRTDVIRYQSPAHLLLLATAGAAALVGVRWRAALGVTAATLLAAGSVLGLASVRAPSLDDQAFAVSVAAAAAMPGRVQVRRPPLWMGGHSIASDLPEFVLSEAGVEVGEDGACFAWVSAGCYRFTHEELRAGEAQRAARWQGEPLRGECLDHLPVAPAPTALAVRAEVRWRARDFHPAAARRPLVGFVPCDAAPPSG